MVTGTRNHHHSSYRHDYSISKGTRLLFVAKQHTEQFKWRGDTFSSPLLRIQPYVLREKTMVVTLCARGPSLRGGRQKTENKERQQGSASPNDLVPSGIPVPVTYFFQLESSPASHHSPTMSLHCLFIERGESIG